VQTAHNVILMHFTAGFVTTHWLLDLCRFSNLSVPASSDVLFNSEAHVIDFVNLKDLPTQSSKMLIKVGYTYVRSYTTGHRAFAVCQRHTAKAGLHSAKCLPCVTHGKPPTAYNGWQSDYLPCVGSRAHGKGFAVCHVGTRQTFSEKIKKKWSAATTSTSTAATVSAAASGGEGPDPPQHLERGKQAYWIQDTVENLSTNNRRIF